MSATSKPERTVRLSVRVSEQERAWLEKQAGKIAVSEYIRHQLFDNGDIDWSKVRLKRRPKRTIHDKQALAQVLALLGQSSVFASLVELVTAARSGSLVVTPEVDAMLRQTQHDLSEIKHLLMQSLGIKEQ